MKKKTLFIMLFICSFFLLSGCSYSDLFGNDSSGVGENVDVIDNETPTEQKVYWQPNKTFTVPNIAEINITSISTPEEINPPKTNGIYRHAGDKEGETYILAKGIFKNLLADVFDAWDNFDGKLIYDNKYKYDVDIKFATDDDTNFYTKPRPLQSLNVYFATSVPSELIKTNKNFSLQLQFVDDSGVSSSIYEYNFTL